MFLEGCDVRFVASAADVGGIFLVELDGWLRRKWGVGTFEDGNQRVYGSLALLVLI